MKLTTSRIIAAAGFLLPATLLLFFALFPSWDTTVQAPFFHFYLVTFFTFASFVVAGFTALSLSDGGAPRHRLLATAFAVMGVIFLMHGAATPGAITFTFNPGIQWGAWLTPFSGAVLLTLASFDTLQRPLNTKTVGQVQRFFIWFCLFFVFVVILVPQWLTAVNQLASPWHQDMVFYLTLSMALFATVRLWRIWRKSGLRVDGVMTVIAAWVVLISISMHRFELWYLSWWLYHILLLAGVIVAVTVLLHDYEKLRQFRLIYYYAATGLVATAALALFASYLFSTAVEMDLAERQVSTTEGVGQNLALRFSNDLPEGATRADLSETGEHGYIFESAEWVGRITGLEIDAITILDDRGDVTYQYPVTFSAPLDDEDIENALAGNSGSHIVPVNLSEDPEAEPTDYFQTFAPIYAGEDILGVFSTLQAYDDLNSLVIQARINGLKIGGITMGLLYLLIMVIILRADRLISARTEELALAYSNLQASESMRDDLTHMIIHDLRSPLTSIGLSMELLEKTGDSPSHRERFISRSQKAINRTMSLVDQLTDVARLETNQLQIDPRPLELDQLLHEKASHFASQIDATDKGIAVEIAFTLPTVFADLDLSSRVLDNLVSNAIKYTEPGGNILIRAEARGQEVVVQVSDDGPGINPEAKEKIFDKYFQVKDADGVPMRRGTGLGLTFCKLAIEAQHGRIWVESVPGEGSTFSFTLPIHH